MQDWPGLLWGNAGPWGVLWVGWGPFPKPRAVTDCIWRPREALKLVKGDLLFLSLAAADGDSIRSLLPLTKSFPRHLRCSVQAVVRALSS